MHVIAHMFTCGLCRFSLIHCFMLLLLHLLCFAQIFTHAPRDVRGLERGECFGHNTDATHWHEVDLQATWEQPRQWKGAAKAREMEIISIFFH